MDPSTGTWDEQLITDVFWPKDAEVILMIPTDDESVDWPAWHYDPKRVFSVKSAYKLAVQLRDQRKGNDPSTSNVTSQNTEDFKWLKLWQIKLLNKIKTFVWLFAHNSLPVRRNVERRGVRLDTRCPICYRFDEDCGHLFFKCKKVKECWRGLCMEHIRELLQTCRSGKEVIEKVWTLQEKEQQKV